jgi:signal transduction histidine kinase
MSMDEQATWTQLFEGLRPALRLALDLEGAVAGVLLVRDDVTPLFLPAVVEGLGAGDMAGLRDIAPDVGALGTAIGRQRRVTITEQASPDDPLAALARSVGMRSLAIVPLATQGECLGAMVLIRSNSPFPDEVDGWTASLTARCAGLAADAVAGIRARRRAEDAYTRIEALGRARLQFLARMTHELRTPLQAIDGYVEMLSAGVPA